jgi:hypothetical protein
MIIRKIISIILVVLSLNNSVNSCTTFIISGKYTSDGKPILFKNRDTDLMDNSLVYFKDGKFDYIALVDANSTWDKMVWGGYNETGFAIINSAAYNNNIGDTSKIMDQEGVIMKLALQSCKTLQDFEELLKNLPKPMGSDANFGVIDAYGGAAYYETGNYKYIKFDVNDSTIAPNGYLVRTNHSYSGILDEGFGFCRYQTASSVMKSASENKQFSPQYLFENISRNLTHSFTNTNLWENIPEDNSVQDLHFFIDYIPRQFSASAILIVGASDEEHDDYTVMWTILGFPLISVAIPTWIYGGENLPKIASMKENLHSPLCDATLKLKENCFPITRGEGLNYINLAAVINQQNTGYMQVLKPIQDSIFVKANQLIAEFDKNHISKSEIQEYYNWLDSFLDESYLQLFNIKLF